LLEEECYSRTKGPAAPLVGYVEWSFPVLLAAIDPQAEERLTGLGQAVTSGRYLM
jgi:hypothetical protein